mgnify:CR=1 FL=1
MHLFCCFLLHDHSPSLGHPNLIVNLVWKGAVIDWCWVCMFESLKHLNHDSMLAGKWISVCCKSYLGVCCSLFFFLLAPRSSIFYLVNKSISFFRYLGCLTWMHLIWIRRMHEAGCKSKENSWTKAISLLLFVKPEGSEWSCCKCSCCFAAFYVPFPY